MEKNNGNANFDKSLNSKPSSTWSLFKSNSDVVIVIYYFYLLFVICYLFNSYFLYFGLGIIIFS